MSAPIISRAELLRELNRRFSTREIRATARILHALPADAEIGAISVALGIVPRAALPQLRRATRLVPPMVAGAWVGGLLRHLATVDRRGGRYAGPKAVHLDIVDGAKFGLAISHEADGMHITMTMGPRPASVSRARR